MNNFIINEEEKSRILSMHTKLIKEQQEKTTITEDPNFTILKNARKVGCLSNGEIFRDKTKNTYFYRKPSSKEPTKEVDFFADMTYKFVDGSKTGKWKCEGLVTLSSTDTEINQLITQFGWKTREDLKNVTQEELTQLYQKHPKFELYKLKVESGKIGGYTDVQQKFIDNAKKLGYKESLTSEETASGKYKQYLVPNSEQYFPGGLKMFYSSETAISSGVDIKQQFKNSVTNQTPTSKKDCRDTISAYYNAWRTKKEIPDVEFEPMKRKVQACVNQYDGEWGGILSKIDEYVDVLRGVQVGDIKGPLSSGGDSKWRLK
jgi:hypothetical protein